MFHDKNPAIQNKVQYIEVSEADVGQRLDNYLIKSWKDVPKSHVYRLIRQGQVRVNGSRSKAHQRLRPGDNVRLPPIRRRPKKQTLIPDHLDVLKCCTLYEDESLLVIDKPSGIAVHGGSGLSSGVIEALRSYREQGTYLELVHRLDRETSGCLMLAKNPRVLRSLHKAFREHSSNLIIKKYVSLLIGEWRYGRREVNLELVTEHRPGERRRSTVAKGGRKATTLFIPMRNFEGYGLVEIELGTGRMHQIRAHAAAVGHPVAGDHKYGSHLANRKLSHLGLKRLFLHAAEVKLEHPETGQVLCVQATMPENLKHVIGKL